MTVAGLRGRGGAGVLWPRLSSGTRTAWRDMHAVTGFWVSGLALMLLVTGLPWAEAWGIYWEENGAALFHDLGRYGIRLPAEC